MNILMISGKGGVGRSLIADEILFSFERSEISTALIDMYIQETLIHADTTESADDAEILVIDSPGILTREWPEWMKDADVLVIPTNPSPRDIGPMMQTIEYAREWAPDVPRIVVVNRYSRDATSVQFLDALQKVTESSETIATVYRSDFFQRAFLEKSSIMDIAPASPAAASMMGAVNAIRKAAGYAPDPLTESIMSAVRGTVIEKMMTAQTKES